MAKSNSSANSGFDWVGFCCPINIQMPTIIMTLLNGGQWACAELDLSSLYKESPPQQGYNLVGSESKPLVTDYLRANIACTQKASSNELTLVDT